MVEHARDEATNLLEHQYASPAISVQEPLVTQTSNGDVAIYSSDSGSSQDEPRIQMAGDEQIELVSRSPVSTDSSLMVVGEQPSSVGTESSTDLVELRSPTALNQDFTGLMRSANGIHISDRLKLAIDEDEEDDLLISTRPTKDQVLHYFARAHKFLIHRVERDFQITDADGFPLFDAYADADCAGRIWTIESYGKPVLFMRDYTSSDWCQRTTRVHVAIRDWNGDFLGELLPGDTFYIHSAGGKVQAKVFRHGSSGLHTVDGSSSEESTALTGSAIADGALPVSSKSSCWLCVEEETERHIARLEDYKTIRFNKDVAFQIKLLSLAAIIRLVGHVGGLTPAAKCVGVVKTILNCCAGY